MISYKIYITTLNSVFQHSYDIRIIVTYFIKQVLKVFRYKSTNEAVEAVDLSFRRNVAS